LHEIDSKFLDLSDYNLLLHEMLFVIIQIDVNNVDSLNVCFH